MARRRVSDAGRRNSAARRIRQMAGLYSNWWTALADRASLRLRDELVLYKVRTRHGRTLSLIAESNSRDVRVINEMWLSRPYLRFIPDTDLEKLRVVLDIGAHRGYFALFIAAHSPDAKVYSFEPDPVSSGILRANVTLNRLDHQVAVDHRAVISHGGRAIELWKSDHPELNTTVAPSDHARFGLDRDRYTEEHLLVDAVSITMATDEVLQAHGHIDLLKIDVEGIELDLICSLPIASLRQIRHLAAEFDLRDDDWSRVEKAVDKLVTAGFETFLDPPYLFAWQREYAYQHPD